MSIKQLSPNLWALDVRISIDYKEYRKREIFSGGKFAAEDRYSEIRKALQENSKFRKKSSLKIETFSDVLEFYLSHKDVKNSISLFTRLKSDLGGIRVDDLANTFDLWLSQMKRSTAKMTGKRLSIATLNRYVTWSKVALNLALRHGHIKENPLRFFKREKEIPRNRVLSDAEKTKLFEVVKRRDPELLPIIAYSFFVPFRKMEMVQAKKSWYDMVNNCIRVPAEITKTQTAVIKPIPDSMTAYFRNIPDQCEWLFYRYVTKYKKYISLGDFKKSLRNCLLEAGISDYHFHDSRRCSYTDLILGGNLPHVVQKISGHKSDMSKVYVGIQGMQAAKLVHFGKMELVHCTTKQDNTKAISI